MEGAEEDKKESTDLRENNNNYYYYVLSQGNNPMLIKRLLFRRPWWRPWSEVIGHNWNLYWIPYVKRELFVQLKQNGQNVTGINHFEFSYKWLTAKNGMYISLFRYCQKINKDINLLIPDTALLYENREDECYDDFVKKFNSYINKCINCGKYTNIETNKCTCSKPNIYRNIWICKPPCSNQGLDIKIFSNIDDLINFVNTPNEAVKYSKQWVVQKYIENPHLYRGRKYDIRVLSFLKSTNNGHGLNGYLYPDSYLRTSSTEFKLDNFDDGLIHLTNDNIQRNSTAFGIFEGANKVCWPGYRHFLIETLGETEGHNTYISIRNQIESLIIDTYNSVRFTINTNHLSKSFQLFGYDFMVDSNYKVWLIEINTNPSIYYDPKEQPFKEFMFPRMLDEFFQLTLDEYFPPINNMKYNGNSLSWSECKELQDEIDDGSNRWKLICTLTTD